MDSLTVRHVIDELLYGLLYERDLNDPKRIEFTADAIERQTSLVRPPAQYVEAIESVLAEGHLPPQGLWELDPIFDHEESEVLDWLSRLARRLSPD